nr:hypothetical protein [Tanacetum cinerariifolium]
MRREMGDMQAELLALRKQSRRAGQPGEEARVPNHQDAPRDNQKPLPEDILGVTILRHTGSHYPKTYWEHYPKTYWASLPKDILGALPEDILGVITRRHTGRHYPKTYWASLPKDILGALPEDILGVITRRHTGSITRRHIGCHYPKTYFHVFRQ